MVSIAVASFLDDKKESFLKKEVRKDLRGKKGEFDSTVQQKSREKFLDKAEQRYGIREWFGNISNIRASVTTHPAKMTNAKIDASVTKVVFQGEERIDGYLRTGNAKLINTFDISRNGATNTLNYDVFEFLNNFVSYKNCKIIDLFKNDDMDLKTLIQSLNYEYNEIKSRCFDLYEGEVCKESTHSFLKQVYFPVDKNYHLLSLKTSSLILYEIKNRIQNLSNIWVGDKHVREFKRDGLQSDTGYSEILNLVAIGYGNLDVKEMGNHSYLNVLNSGIAHALPSIPPLFEKRMVRLPRDNFFRQTLYLQSEKELFLTLHKWVRQDRNNSDVKQKITKIIKKIIDQILYKAYQLRYYHNQGWSTQEYYQQLPLSQRIWLDDIHLEHRKENNEWRDDIAEQIARIIIDNYEDINDVTSLGNEVFTYIKGKVRESIEEDKEFF